MHPVAAQRILRLALGTALSLFVSQIAGWQMSFIAPVFTLLILALPLPAPGLRQGVVFVVALLAPWNAPWIRVMLFDRPPLLVRVM